MLVPLLVAAFFVGTVSLTGWATWTQERQLNTWPDDNWLAPTTHRGAMAIVLLPTLTYLAGVSWVLAIALIRSLESAGGPLLILAMLPSPLLATIDGFLLWRAVRSAPPAALTLTLPFNGSQNQSAFAQLGHTAMAGFQSFRIQGQAADFLGWPAPLLYVARVTSVGAFVAAMAFAVFITLF